MYQNILAAFDNSPRGKYVFEAALALAKAHNASLMLLHVLSKDSQDSPFNVPPKAIGYTPESVNLYLQQWENFKQESLELLEYLVQQALVEGVNADFVQLDGQPGKMICAFAQEWDADLIVIGRRGYSEAEEMFLGSVSSYVIHRSHCSVHIVIPKAISF
jgi:nucleotide-binding universal stress UspA family protein